MKYFILITYLLAIVGCFYIPVRLREKHHLPEFVPKQLSKLTFSIGLWTMTVALEQFLTPGTWTYFVHEFRYVFIFASLYHACDLIFSITFVSAKHRRWNTIFQTTVSTVLLILIASNGFHHWFRISQSTSRVIGLNAVISVNGPLYQYVLIYIYGVFGFFIASMFFMMISLSPIYRKQYIKLIFAPMIPFVVSFIFQSHYFKGLIIDPVPLSFFLSIWIYYYIISRNDVLFLSPLKNSKMTRYLTNPYILVSRSGRITDTNKEFEEFFNLPHQKIFGVSFEKFLDEFSIDLGKKYYHKGKRYYRIDEYELLNDDGSNLGTSYLFIDATKEHEYMKELEFLSFHDSLTGVYNKHFLNSNYKGYFDETRLPIGIIFSDANGLKKVNDHHGHEVGDQALIEMTRSIQSVLKNDEPVIRLGGDEFLILVPKASEDILKTLENAITEAVKEKSSYGLSISCGHAIYESLDEDFRDFIAKADQMMYRTKNDYYTNLMKTMC